MPRTIDIQGVGPVDFPDGMSDGDIAHAIETELVPQLEARKAATPIATTQPEGLLSKVARKLGETYGASAEEVSTATEGDVGLGLAEGVDALRPHTWKEAGILAGIAGISTIPVAGPPVAGLIIGAMAAQGAGQAAGELSVAAQQGDVRGITRESTKLAANLIFAKQGGNLVKGGADVLLSTRAARASESLAREQELLPPAGHVVEEGSAEIISPEGVIPPTPEQARAAAASEARLRAATIDPSRRIPSGSPQSLGISPSLSSLGPTPSPAGFAVAAAKDMNKVLRGVEEQVAMRDTKDNVAASSDAVSTMANNYARQVSNDARFEVIGRSVPRNDTLEGLTMNMFTEGERLDLQAMTPIVEAGAEITKLQAAVDKVVNAPDVEASLKRVYDHALINFARLGPKAARIVKAFDDQLAAERAAGIETDFAQNYVTHRYDFDVMMGPNKPVVLDASGGKGFMGSSFFRKNRVFQSYADAIEAGYRPKTLDIADLLEHRVRAGQRNINSRAWVQGMRAIDSPVSGTPLVTDMLTQPNGAKVPPLGYETWTPVPGITVALNETIKPLVDTLTNDRGLPAWMMKPISFSKHILLAVDSFHAMRMMYRGMGLGQFGYKKGLSTVEYTDAGLAEAVRAGEINQNTANWAKANRPIVELGQQHGLNVGRISDAIYKSVVDHVPGVAPFTKFVFDKLTRGVMAQSYVWAYKRNAKLFPELTPDVLARRTAMEINTYYGNLMSQGLFRGKRSQDMMRLAFLAPQWVEALARTEIGAIGQAAKAPLDLTMGKGIRTGTLARGVGTATLGFLVMNQLINHFTQGGFTWNTNPEGHKLDAYLPDWIEGSKGYWLSPMGTSMELTHDMENYVGHGMGVLAAGGRIIGNKAGQAARIGSDLVVGQTIGEPSKPLVDTSDRFKEALADALPMPLGLKMFQDSYIGSQQRQMASSIGIKIEKFRTAAEEKRADKGRAFHRMEDVVDAAVIDIRRHPGEQATILKEAKGKLEPKQWVRARAEITRRSRKR